MLIISHLLDESVCDTVAWDYHLHNRCNPKKQFKLYT